MTTALLPAGRGAPVTISTALPFFKVKLRIVPTSAFPVSCSFTGLFSSAWKVSSSMTAYPSTVDLSNGGTSIGEIRSSARTLPTAFVNSTVSASRGLRDADSSIICIASSRLSSFLNILPNSAKGVKHVNFNQLVFFQPFSVFRNYYIAIGTRHCCEYS